MWPHCSAISEQFSGSQAESKSGMIKQQILDVDHHGQWPLVTLYYARLISNCKLKIKANFVSNTNKYFFNIGRGWSTAICHQHVWAQVEWWAGTSCTKVGWPMHLEPRQTEGRYFISVSWGFRGLIAFSPNHFIGYKPVPPCWPEYGNEHVF